MSEQINILLQKSESGYFAFCKEIKNHTFQDDSLDVIFDQLKNAIRNHIQKTNELKRENTGESILKMVNKFSNDITEEEINKLPTDAAENIDYYLYGIQKK